MLCAIDKNGERTIARETDKHGGPFNCPACGAPVHVKKGLVLAHHFAHHRDGTCRYGAGESEQHRRAKQELYDLFRSRADTRLVDLEVDHGSVISDVYVEFKTGEKLALEVQKSNLQLDEMRDRTSSYYNLGIHVLWLPLFTPKLLEDNCVLKPWEYLAMKMQSTPAHWMYHYRLGVGIVPVMFSPVCYFKDLSPEAVAEHTYIYGKTPNETRRDSPYFTPIILGERFNLNHTSKISFTHSTEKTTTSYDRNHFRIKQSDFTVPDMMSIVKKDIDQQSTQFKDIRDIFKAWLEHKTKPGVRKAPTDELLGCGAARKKALFRHIKRAGYSVASLKSPSDMAQVKDVLHIEDFEWLSEQLFKGHDLSEVKEAA